MIQKKVWLAVFLVGATIGVRVAPVAGEWSSSDVLTPVLALGIALPAGWLGLGAIKRR